ncbi:hypothetical protein [Bosea vaviloviae]|uniref:Restriction endonuclease n=1 Tax=Bosea vaviloviae TaxID=1526658 RepID=A0A1D7TWZ4_9HYPH|nr:hypothetical protein [Bosea vaviloviae]AOO79650.1 hypothetical protein BHK69_03365 [Bosea vaviloviae]
MTYVPVERAAEFATRLLGIFRELGFDSAPLEGVEAGVISLWDVLENLASPGDPHNPAIAEKYVSGAGLHDLAAKVVAVWDHKLEARSFLAPHIKLLAEAHYTGQNASNPRWDRKDGIAREQGSADKVIELYWACLCILADMSVEIDDPEASSGGRNPDVIATAADGTRWAFALKTLARVPHPATAAKNLMCNIKKACEQIERAECDKGIVVVNLKNVLDHDALRSAGTFANEQAAQCAINAQISQILEPFYANEVVELEHCFAQRGKVAPMVALVAHSTVFMQTPDSFSAFAQVNTMMVATLPTRDEPKPGTFMREACALAEDLNRLVWAIK